jgi:hypothetical protein
MVLQTDIVIKGKICRYSGITGYISLIELCNEKIFASGCSDLQGGWKKGGEMKTRMKMEVGGEIGQDIFKPLGCGEDLIYGQIEGEWRSI